MTDRDTSVTPPRLPEFSKSIFPTFNVNVPMPADTAIPGSYNKPAQQSSPASPAASPAKVAE
jgi:hypothetical protein